MRAPAPDAPVWIYGANSVHATLKSRPRDVVEVCFAEHKDNPRLDSLREEAEAAGDHCSETEKTADDATRAVAKYLKCLYVQDRIGERFSGIIVGVTNFGLFIELDKVHVEGLLHVTSLDSDYYFFDGPGHRLVGESSGRVYRLGDRIEVVLVSVEPEERKIDFALPDSGGSRRPRRRRRR